MAEIDQHGIASCRQEACPIGESGKCLEGLDPKNCSHFYWMDSRDAQELDELKNEKGTDHKFKLYSGEDLSVDELKMITHKFRSNLIVIIGESDSGKTTMLSSIFDLFQTGKFEEFQFSGSLTPIGFEKRCHLSRVSSRANVQETEKTTSNEFKFLHLAVKKSTALRKRPNHLLISDISGERFQNASVSSAYMRELEILKQADHIVCLLDGKKLADKLNRTSVIHNSQQFIRRALDVGFFDINTEITVVTSKFDLLETDENFNFSDLIEVSYERKFGHELKKIDFLKIAARPLMPSENITFGYGLEKLLNIWITQRFVPFILEPTAPASSFRYFDKFRISHE